MSKLLGYQERDSASTRVVLAKRSLQHPSAIYTNIERDVRTQVELTHKYSGKNELI